MPILSDAKILIHLDQYQFQPGDVITGSLELVLPEDTQTDGISINLLGIKKLNTGTVSLGHIERTHHNNHFFNTTISIRPPEICGSQRVPFSYLIPAGILPKRFGGIEKLGSLPDWVINIVNILIQVLAASQPTNYLVPTFTLTARIHIPWGIDITESIPVSITQGTKETINI